MVLVGALGVLFTNPVLLLALHCFPVFFGRCPEHLGLHSDEIEGIAMSLPEQQSTESAQSPTSVISPWEPGKPLMSRIPKTAAPPATTVIPMDTQWSSKSAKMVERGVMAANAVIAVALLQKWSCYTHGEAVVA